MSCSSHPSSNSFLLAYIHAFFTNIHVLNIYDSQVLIIQIKFTDLEVFIYCKYDGIFFIIDIGTGCCILKIHFDHLDNFEKQTYTLV